MNESNEIYEIAARVASTPKAAGTQSIGLGPSVHIPLRDAYICASCDAISNNSTVCPACADTSLLPLNQLVDSVNPQ
jgi:hypothetical protein